MAVCPFANPPRLCRNDCALYQNDKCAFLVIAESISSQNQKQTEKKDQE